MINYGDISNKLISGTFTSSSLFSNSSNLRDEIYNMLLHCWIQNFFLRGVQKEPQKQFQSTFKALNTAMDKIVKIRTQLAKYNVFCGTEASSIISSVTQYRITKNYDHHTHCSSLMTIHYCRQEKNYYVVFHTTI